MNDLQSLKKQAAEITKIIRTQASTERAAKKKLYVDQSGDGTNERRSQTREETLLGRIRRIVALLQTGEFETIEQLAVSMTLTVAQVHWALRHARERGLISGPLYMRLVGQA